MKLVPKLTLAAAGFIVAGFVLGMKLLNPTQIQITIQGAETRVLPIQEVFTLPDVLVIAVSAVILSITAMYIGSYDNKNRSDDAGKISEERQAVETERQKMDIERQKWQHTLKTLKDDEKTVYELIFADGGIMFQNELIEKTKFSPAKVTRCLDALENRGIIKRKRKGVHNIVSL
jgi:uncharacterized membrane protein